jgi:hypothetical protein
MPRLDPKAIVPSDQALSDKDNYRGPRLVSIAIEDDAPNIASIKHLRCIRTSLRRGFSEEGGDVCKLSRISEPNNVVAMIGRCAVPLYQLPANHCEIMVRENIAKREGTARLALLKGLKV